MDATLLGDHRFDHQLDDISPSARAGWLEHARRQLNRLEQTIDRQKLSRDGQIDFDIFRDDLIRNIWLAEQTRPFEEDPRVYGTYINDSVYTLLVQSTLPREKNIENAIARVTQIPRIVDEAKRTLNRPPRSVLETAISQNRGAIRFYEQEIFDIVGDTPQKERLRQATLPAVETLRGYQKYLEEELLPTADGQWRLGRERFFRKLELVLELGLSADQVLSDAESEFERVQNELYVIARQLWSRYFPDRPLPPDDRVGRRTTVALVVQAASQDHGEPSALVADARGTVAGIQRFIRERDLLRLPESDRCQIIEMPEFRRGNSLAYLEPAQPLDPLGVSFYAVSPPPAVWDPDRVRSFLEEYNRHMLQILTIHEAYPGHYVQLEYSNRCPRSSTDSAIGRLYRRLGGLYRANDARSGVWRWISAIAVKSIEVLSAGRRECHPRSQDALHRYDGYSGFGILDTRCVSIGRGSSAEDHSSQAEFCPIEHLFHWPNGPCSAPPGDSIRNGRIIPFRSLPRSRSRSWFGSGQVLARNWFGSDLPALDSGESRRRPGATWRSNAQPQPPSQSKNEFPRSFRSRLIRWRSPRRRAHR